MGSLAIDVEFALDRPWTVLFGPSGSGKSTILRAIAGLLRPNAGLVTRSVAEDAEDAGYVTIVDTEAGIFVPPHRRGIRLASQAASLFPHLTVAENVGYGCPMARTAAQRQAREQHLASVLDSFELAALARKYPGQLSGGEAQRVNLARAIAPPECRLLLLDEPFTGLDPGLRDRLQTHVSRTCAARSIPILSVTHDVAEPFQLGAHVLRLEEGRIVRTGSAAQVLGEERGRLLALLCNL